MTRRTFSGYEVAKVMVNSGIYEWDRTRGDHAILRWEPPDDHDADARTVPVPLHDELSIGTLRNIADLAGAKDFDSVLRVDRRKPETQERRSRLVSGHVVSWSAERRNG